MIVDKHSAILNYAVIPVVCDKCGYTEEMSKPIESATIDALIEVSYLHEFEEELEILTGKRKPEWRGFALYLLNATFNWGSKKPRTQFVVASIERIKRGLDRDRLKCPHCQFASIRIETEFFDNLM